MNEQKLDIDFIKQNLDQSGLIGQIGWGAVQALITTAIIIGAVFSVLNVDKLAEYIQLYVYTSIISGIVISILLAVQWYYGKLYRLFDVFYTSSIDNTQNTTELILRTIASVVLALLVAGVLYFSQYYGAVIITIGVCSVVSTGFIYYVFRNKMVDWQSYVLYAVLGIATGTSAYLLGTLVVIAIGLIGFWLTIGILTLETVFTAVYTYLGLLDWVAHEKEVRKDKLGWEEKRKQEEEAKEILSRLTPP